MALSLKAEKHLERLLAQKAAVAAAVAAAASAVNNRTGTPGELGESPASSAGSHSHGGGGGGSRTNLSSNVASTSSQPQPQQQPQPQPQQQQPQHGLQYQNHEGTDSVIWGTPNAPQPSSGLVGDEDLEERALALAIEETWEESGKKWRPWAANGRATRIGEIVLLVDSDTVVPEDCLRDAAREMAACPTVAILQHESGAWIRVPVYGEGTLTLSGCLDVMQVAHHYFENGIAYFTRRINKCISMCMFAFLFYFLVGRFSDICI